MAPLPKKSLFSKPAFSRGTAAKVSSSATPIDLFSRADLSYSAFVEEQEEKRAERRNAKAARRVAESTSEDGQVNNTRKRQRISISSSSSSEESSNHDRNSNALSPPPDSPKIDLASRSKASKLHSVGLKSQQSHKKPELPDSNSRDAVPSRPHGQDPEVVFVASSSPTHHSEEIELPEADEQVEDEHESDDEIAELARKAREAARQKRESRAENMAHSFQADPLSATQNDRPSEVAFIMIHIESPLPGAETKTLKRRLDQRLRQLRLAWCEANGFSEEERQKIILMFRGRRVFDFNTPESLGICVDSQGEPYVRGDDPLAPAEPPGDIVMEAIPEDAEEAYISDWRREHGLAVTTEDEDKTTDAQPPSQESVQKPVKIICRARNFPDFKVAVKMSTTVARIQAAFTMKNELSEDTEVSIMLDGEVLHAEATIEDLGIEDMDVLDVQVK